MDRLAAMEIFLRVVEAGSFGRAADSLGLPRSTVSLRIRALEAHLGTRLLHRTTRRMRLTLDGEAFRARAERLLADLAETEALFRPPGEAPRGRLRIDVPGRIGRHLIAPALPDFLARYPGITLEIGVTDRPVNLVAEGVDVAVRVGPLAESGLVARRLGALRQASCAAPAYLARHGLPASPEALVAAGHLAVGYGVPQDGRGAALDFLGPDGVPMTVRLPVVVAVDDAETYLACCRAGLGLIQLPAYDARPLLQAGLLVEVLPDWPPPPMPITLLYPARRHLSRRLRAFTGWFGTLCRARMELVSPDLAGTEMAERKAAERGG